MRNIRIPLDMIEASCEDKALRDAIVISIGIKSNFSSSNLHYKRERNGKTCLNAMRELFKCSHITFNRMLLNAIKLGFIRRNGDYIIANPIRERGAYSVCLPTVKGMSLQRINKALDNVVYSYKVMCLNNASYSIKMANGVLVHSHKDLKKYNKAKKNTTESERASGFYDIISYDTLSKLTNVSRLQAIRDIKHLVRIGTIQKEEKVQVIEDKPLNSYDLAILNESEYGFFFNKRVDGQMKLVHQMANAYTLNAEVTSLFKFDWSFDKYEEYRSFKVNGETSKTQTYLS